MTRETITHKENTMSIINDVRKRNQTNFYAAVGVLDLAVEEVREASDRAAKRRSDLRAELKDFDAADLQARVAAIPGKTIDSVMTFVHDTNGRVEDLAARGEKLVDRIRNQKATKDFVAQAENTVGVAKGAMTTARNSVAEVEKAAKATLTTGQKEAVRAATVITESVQDEAKTAADEVEKSVKRTRTAAKRATTTTKTGAKRTTSRAKAASTTAKKAAAAAPKAAADAADKVGA